MFQEQFAIFQYIHIWQVLILQTAFTQVQQTMLYQQNLRSAGDVNLSEPEKHAKAASFCHLEMQ